VNLVGVMRMLLSKFTSLLARLGRLIFGVRLFVGLGVAALSLEWLEPTPFLNSKYRLMQLLAFALIAGGLALRTWASGSAGRHTRTANIEAPELITGGPFAYVRNPIYVGTMVLALGMALLIGDKWAIVCATLTLAVLYVVIVPAEEAFLQRRFGEAYGRYCAAVPRLFPRLRPWGERCERPFQWQAARGELMIFAWLVVIYGALQFEEYLDRVGIS